MLSLRKLLFEVSPKQADKDNMDARAASGELGYDPDAEAKKQKMGVPAGAKHAGFGRWIDASGKTLGFTRNGKFIAAAADADKKATARYQGVHDPRVVAKADNDAFKGNTITGTPDRGQQSRTARAKDKERSDQARDPKVKLQIAATNAAERLSRKIGINDQNFGKSKEQRELQWAIVGNEMKLVDNPIPGATDKKVAFMPLDDYRSKYANGASEREIEALSKFNAKFPDRSREPGAPVGVHRDAEGKSYILLRSKHSAQQET
jgi:hypothetical protein